MSRPLDSGAWRKVRPGSSYLSVQALGTPEGLAVRLSPAPHDCRAANGRGGRFRLAGPPAVDRPQIHWISDLAGDAAGSIANAAMTSRRSGSDERSRAS